MSRHRLACSFTVFVALTLGLMPSAATTQVGTFDALIDAASASYQAYLAFPTTGDARTVALTMRMRVVPGTAREFALDWTDANTGAPLPQSSPFDQLPRRLVVGARGLTVDAYGPTLPRDFDALAPRPAHLRSGRMITYARDSVGCFELYAAGASDEAYRAVRACFARDGILREFFFDSSTASIELAGPVTLPRDLVGAWSGSEPRSGRTASARLALDGANRLIGTYVTTAAWATECTVVQLDDADHPEAVAVRMRCEERLGGDAPSVEHADCAFSLVGGELIVDRCAVESVPLRRALSSASPR